MGEYFTKDLFKNSPQAIFCDDTFEEFEGKGYGRKQYGVGNVLGKCLGHNDVSLTEFFMEEFSHRRDHMVKLFGINMVEVQKNRA